jgi:para-aminobenzoate synthetase component 1
MSQFVDTCNTWAAKGLPFLFIINYELEEFRIERLSDAAKKGYFFNVNGNCNTSGLDVSLPKKFQFDLFPVNYEKYESAFDLVGKHILHGNSFLLNLTFPTPIRTDLKLDQIFQASSAPYKLLYKNEFVVFSPETFVRINEDHIYSYPMKGTIDADLPDSETKLLEDDKEHREHVTIVDLIRNDLSIVSKDVTVTKFKYIDRIKTHKNELLQLSSEIRGLLPENWKNDLGNILLKLLPAGSISGAPKKKTLEIISEAEGQKRGFFTGIFGIFDGKKLDSGVMIRYIEKTGNSYQFRSGGGITGCSKVRDEYNEMIEKVYVPII